MRKKLTEISLKRFRLCLYTAFILIMLSSAIIVFFYSRSLSVTAAISMGTFFIFLLIIVNNRRNERYNDDLLENLSLLTERIINMEDSGYSEYKSIFPENQDTLTSRFQEQIQKLNRILRLQNDRITREQNRIKTLVSDISHQIKTPVASIKMFSELLQDPEITVQERNEYSEVLQKSLDKLTFLTDGMIKMSRLESGIIRLHLEPVDISELILQTAAQVQHAAKAKNISFIVGQIGSYELFCDRNWTTEALANIAENAVKYTPEGGKVEICVQEYPSYLCVKIADDGMGISEEEQAMIFQRFYRGKQSAGKDGIGLGLYLSRKIILDQNGYIKVSSNENGSTFSIFLKKNIK